LPAADRLATAAAFGALALLPLPLHAWAWRLGVVELAQLGRAALAMAAAGALGTAAVHLAARACRTYGGAVSLALLMQGAGMALWVLL